MGHAVERGVTGLAGGKLSPEDLYGLALVSNPQMCSDGSVVYVLSNMEKDRYISRLMMYRGGKHRVLAADPHASIACPVPGPGGLVAVERPLEKDEKGQRIMLVDPDTGARSVIASLDKPVLDMRWAGEYRLIVSVLEGGNKYSERDFFDVRRLPVWANGAGWMFDRHTALYELTVPSGRLRRITPEGVNVGVFDASPGGWVVYALHRYELAPYEADLVAENLRTGEKRVLVRRMSISAVSLGGECEELAVRGNFRERGGATHHRIYLIGECKRGRLECVTCDLGLNTINTVNSDVRGPSCARSLQWLGDELFFPVHSAGGVSIYKYASSGEPVPAIEAADSVVDEYSVSRKATAYTLMTSIQPKELYLSGHGRVSAWNKWLENYAMTRPVRGAAHRGEYSVDYWVLPPVGVEECERCVPWILYIHGGPKTSFGHGFMFEFHVLAARGYAVVYSNPHGSDGYSEEFADIRGRYGTIDYEDLMAVARDAVRRHKYLSDKHKAVAGGSYGGWMTNHIITTTSEFEAAITMRSCSNWPSFYGASDIGWWFAEDHIGGKPWTEPEMYVKASPLFRADKASTPTLIIHSTADYRCPVDQAISFYTALRVNGVKTRLALFPGENHDLMRSGTPRRRVARLNLILEWLDEHLRAGKK